MRKSFTSGLPRLFKTKKPRQFKMHTRYYNAEQEKREERWQRIKSDADAPEETEQNIRFKRRISFRNQSSEALTRSEYRKQLHRSNMRLLYLVVILGMVTYTAITLTERYL